MSPLNITIYSIKYTGDDRGAKIVEEQEVPATGEQVMVGNYDPPVKAICTSNNTIGMLHQEGAPHGVYVGKEKKSARGEIVDKEKGTRFRVKVELI